jgi:osmotically-inducible protein OsmY
MKNTLLFTTLLAGLALTGCNKTTRTSTASTDPAVTTTTTERTVTATPSTTSTDTVGAKIDRTGDRMADASRNAADNVRDASHSAANSMRNAGHDISARMSEWRLSNNDIEADVNASRPVIRTRSSAGAPTGKIDKGTIEKAIKGRLNADAQLADLKFDANANAKGEVELEGKARSLDQISHAIGIALDTDGVTQVTSKIKLDPNAGPNRK